MSRFRAAIVVAGLVTVVFPFASASAKSGSAKSASSGVGTAKCADGTVTYSPTTVWPPDGKMQTIDISYTAPKDKMKNSDKTSISVGFISADDNAKSSDSSGTFNSGSSPEGSAATTTAKVRAFRSGSAKTGRHYKISVMCSESGDLAGGGSASLTVTVPHDQGT